MSNPDPRAPGFNAHAGASGRFGAQAVERLQAAFERTAHPMLVADDRRRWVTGNRPACELLGLAREDLAWRTMDDFTPPGERGALEERWAAFLARGEAEGWGRLYVPDRGPVPVEFSATANVVPARHLLVLIPPDEASAEQRESVWSSGASWESPVAKDTGRLRLTGREREVMTLVASGLQSGDIAERLYLSPETVKSHVHNAMGKLGSHTRAHAVAIAMVTAQITWDLSTPPESPRDPPPATQPGSVDLGPPSEGGTGAA